MPGTVLQNVKETFGSKPGSRIGTVIKDKQTGRKIGYRATLKFSDGPADTVLTGFKYLPDPPESIGVMEKVARIAASEDRAVVVYFDDRYYTESLLFHPRAFLDHGERRAKNEERQERNEQWLNLDRDWGATLREYAEGRNEPRTQPPGSDQPQQADMDAGWL